jgi:glycosyltransferase involved in cell wall biosynthesis
MLERPAVSSEKAHARRNIIGTFIHTYGWGHQIRGDERGYIEKVKRYRALGIEFFTLEKDPSIQDSMGEHLYTSLKLSNCSVPPQNIGQLVMLSLYSLRATIRRYPSRPIAIYAYNQDIENLWVAYLLKVLVGAPLVVVYHQIDPAAFSSFGRGIVDRTRRGYHPVRAIFKSLLPALNRFAASHADVHIALSEATRKDVEKYLGVEDCAVIGNGLDTEKFHPLSLPKVFDSVFLGRLARQKGVDVLLRAWSEVVRENSHSQLLLLGGGNPEDVSLYRRMVMDLQLEGNVTFAGFVGDEELVRLLNSSKLFVFPSRKEGFAQAVSQAMGCGLCCILSDIPPLKEVYGGAAVFFPVDQPTALAERIRSMLGAEDERKLFSERARQLAERFSWEDTVKRELAQLSK